MEKSVKIHTKATYKHLNKAILFLCTSRCTYTSLIHLVVDTQPDSIF